MREKVLWGGAGVAAVVILTILGIYFGPQFCGWLFRHHEPISPGPKQDHGLDMGQRPIIIKGFTTTEHANAAFNGNDYPQYGNHHIAYGADKLDKMVAIMNGRCIRYVFRKETSYLVSFNTSDGGKIDLFSAGYGDLFDLVLTSKFQGVVGSGGQVTFTCAECYVSPQHPTFIPDSVSCNDAGGNQIRPCTLPPPDATTVIYINDINAPACGPPLVRP